MESAQYADAECPPSAADDQEAVEMKKGTTKIWTDEAIATLRRLFHNTPSQDIADIIGCSDNSVLLKAKQLGLKRDPDYSRHNFIGRFTGRGRFKPQKNNE